MSDRPPLQTQTRIVGLTGGIGMGKSTVSHYLETVEEIPVIDADVLARDAVAAGSPILEAIAHRYGNHLLRSDHSLDRAALGAIVFQNADERRWLEGQIHPYVRDRMMAEVERLSPTHPLIVLVVPLLFEAHMTDLVTEVWVVFCPYEQQVKRLLQRHSASGNPLSRAQVEARIASQMPIAEKCRRADVVLDNSTTEDALIAQIRQALHRNNSAQLKIKLD